MAVPSFVYGLLLLIEAFSPLEVPMVVDLVTGGSVEEQFLLENEGTVYRVRELETRSRRLEIERSRIYGHVFFVFLSDELFDEAEEEQELNVAAVDYAGVFAALAASQPSEARELPIETPDGGTWTILLRGDSIIIASIDEALFLHARPAVAVLQ